MYNYKLLLEMEPNNRGLHLAKMDRWLASTTTANILQAAIDAVIQMDTIDVLQMYSKDAEYSLAYHYNAYEEELIRRDEEEKLQEVIDRYYSHSV